jgi:hypothetical protein
LFRSAGFRRAVATSDEKTATSFMGVLCLATTLDCTKR